MSGAGRPTDGVVDAAGLSLAIAATRWHAEITDSLVRRARAAAPASRSSCGWPVRWNCPWWRPNSPPGTTPWSASAR